MNKKEQTGPLYKKVKEKVLCEQSVRVIVPFLRKARSVLLYKAHNWITPFLFRGPSL